MSDDAKQAPRTTPAKLEELTAGRLSPDSRRKIRRAFGDGAMQALEDCRLLAYEAQLQQSVLARELLETTARLETRLTGVAAWCETNEKFLLALRADVNPQIGALQREQQEQRGHLELLDMDMRRRLTTVEQLQDANISVTMRFMAMSFWQRVRWLLGGNVPGLPERLYGSAAGGGRSTVTEPRTPEDRETFAADIGRP